MTSTDVLNLFEEKRFVKACAPMVRYSKLQFRTLVRQYGCDLCFTPMIIADSFCKSQKARDSELSINQQDTPLIIQFAANTVHDFVGAAYLVSPYCNGVDLNCGCPQTWAKQMGLGCVMLQKPELIADLVKQCRNKIPKPFTVSVKTRILSDIKKSVEICRQLEKAGVSFLTIHARTPNQMKGDIDEDALKVINDSLSCPIIANGGIKRLDNCNDLHDKTGCKGVMVANNLLTNPMLFSGSDTTTTDCIQKWLDICYNSTLNFEDYVTLQKNRDIVCPTIAHKPKNLTFQCFHHHLVFMLEKILIKRKRRIFNNYQSFTSVLDFIHLEYGLRPKLYDIDDYNRNNAILNLDYKDRIDVYDSISKSNIINNFNYNYENNHGKYFNSKLGECNEIDCDLSGIYEEM